MPLNNQASVNICAICGLLPNVGANRETRFRKLVAVRVLAEPVAPEIVVPAQAGAHVEACVALSGFPPARE